MALSWKKKDGARRRRGFFETLREGAMPPGRGPGSLLRGIVRDMEGQPVQEPRVPHDVLAARYRRLALVCKMIAVFGGLCLTGVVATGMRALDRGGLWDPSMFLAAGGLFTLAYLRAAFRLWVVRGSVSGRLGGDGRIVRWRDYLKDLKRDWSEVMPLPLPPPIRRMEETQ